MKKLIRRTIIAAGIVYAFVATARGAAMLISIYPWMASVFFWAVVIAIVTKVVYVFLDS